MRHRLTIRYKNKQHFVAVKGATNSESMRFIRSMENVVLCIETQYSLLLHLEMCGLYLRISHNTKLLHIKKLTLHDCITGMYIQCALVFIDELSTYKH